jgi:hypothetical protein
MDVALHKNISEAEMNILKVKHEAILHLCEFIDKMVQVSLMMEAQEKGVS